MPADLKAPFPPAAPGKAWGTTLAFVAGYVDTLGFIALFGLFTAHVTGNFVLIGKELSGHGEGVLLKLLAFPAFIASVACTRLLARGLNHRGHSAVRTLLVLQAVLLLAFMAAGLWAAPIMSPEGGRVLLTGILGVIAMAVHNTQSRLELGTLVPTTVMTGNVTQVVIDAVDLLVGGWGAADATTAKARMAKMLPAVIGFGVGAIGGAMAWQFIGFLALLLPVAMLLALALRKSPAA